MITTAAIDDGCIEQFKKRVEQHPHVKSVGRNHGRSLTVRVEETESGYPKPWSEWNDTELIDGEFHAPDFVINKLSGGGLTPRGYAHEVAVSPYCIVCEEFPQENDHGLCSDCQHHRNLLTGPSGVEAVVQAVFDESEEFGNRYDSLEIIRAEADEDGLLRDENDEVFNANAYKVVQWA